MKKGMRVWQIWQGTKGWFIAPPEHEVIAFVGEDIGCWEVEPVDPNEPHTTTFFAYQTEEGEIIIQRLKRARNPGGNHYSKVWKFPNIDVAGRFATTALYNLESDHQTVREWRKRWLNS